MDRVMELLEAVEELAACRETLGDLKDAGAPVRPLKESDVALEQARRELIYQLGEAAASREGAQLIRLGHEVAMRDEEGEAAMTSAPSFRVDAPIEDCDGCDPDGCNRDSRRCMRVAAEVGFRVSGVKS